MTDKYYNDVYSHHQTSGCCVSNFISNDSINIFWTCFSIQCLSLFRLFMHAEYAKRLRRENRLTKKKMFLPFIFRHWIHSVVVGVLKFQRGYSLVRQHGVNYLTRVFIIHGGGYLDHHKQQIRFPGRYEICK